MSDHDLVIIDISDFEEEMDLISDTYSVEHDLRENVLLPKVNVMNKYTSKIPSISDLYCRKKQVALFKKRDELAELVWQYHVLMATCPKDWSCIKHLRLMFYALLYRQRKIELEIINLQLSKGMVCINESPKVYETVVITYNNVNYFSNGKLTDHEPYKTDGIKQLTIKLDRLLVTLETLLKRMKDIEKINECEQAAKRLSLMIINITKIVVVLYDTQIQ
jgi:hypothetical protein